MRRAWFLLFALALLSLCAVRAEAQSATSRPAWSDDVLQSASTLPMQHGGRVKPLSTFAGFQLLKMNGKRSFETPEGEKLEPMAWLLDCFFYPELARDYEMFLVQNSEVLVNAGMHLGEKKRRDRWSYDDLAPARQKLMETAQAAIHKEANERTLIDRQSLELATNLRDFEQLIQFMEFARHRFDVGSSPMLQQLWEGDSDLPLSGLLDQSEALYSLLMRVGATGSGADRGTEVLVQELSFFAEQGLDSIGLLPPPEGSDPQQGWLGPQMLIGEVFSGTPYGNEHGEVLKRFLALEETKGTEAFETELDGLHGLLVGLAEEQGAYGKIPLEVSFYEGQYFIRALACFLLAFLLMAISWLRLGNSARYLTWGTWIASGLGAALLITGITLRCVIQSRPPVTTLYETILFITASAVVVCFVIERLTRQRVALAVATVLGALGMFLSTRYEFKEAANAQDTMPSLVAVLDTNFWLSTHVTSVTMGYAAGLLASAIAHVWLFGKLFGIRAGDKPLYQSIARMVYGVICFGLLFSVVGTILGGIWANYSWGRFWGWDPKENGALLICLWEILILHARMGGYVRDFGLVVLSIIGGGVVAFSWWGVNLLGVGLHSYGFTTGVGTVLNTLYVFEALVLGGAFLWWVFQRGKQTALAEAKPVGRTH